MIFKIGILNNFAIMKPLFATANTFFQLNFVFIENSLKIRAKPQRQPMGLFLEKMCS